MSRLIETIRIADGRIYNADLHKKRIETSSVAVFGRKPLWDVDRLFNPAVTSPDTFKFRIVYNDIDYTDSIDPYTIRPVVSLKLVTDNDIVYDHKFEDRSRIEQLVKQKGDRDDVLIIKNGMVTDVSYANIVFKKNNEWFTPSTCLLNGTMRQSLVNSKKIKEIPIAVTDINTYSHFKLINAMLAFDAPESEVLNIR